MLRHNQRPFVCLASHFLPTRDPRPHNEMVALQMAGNKRRPDHRTQKQLDEDNGMANGNDERHSLGLSLSLAAFWQPPAREASFVIAKWARRK